MKKSILALATAAVLALGATQAAAATWLFQSGALSDGGSITGQFDYDAATNTYSNVNITTTAGSRRSGASYDLVTGTLRGSSAYALQLVDTTSTDVTGASYLGLIFASPLTDLGGTVFGGTDYGTNGFYEGTCMDATCANINNVRRVTSFEVSVAPVPLPAGLPLVLTGLGALAALRLRRRAA